MYKIPPGGRGSISSSRLLSILLKEPTIEKALLTLHVMTETHFTSEKNINNHAWSCQNAGDALTFLLDNIFYSIWHQVV